MAIPKMIGRWTVKLLGAENGDIILPLPEELMEKMLWKNGDVLELRLQQNDCIFVNNLSVQCMYASKFRRNINTVIRKLNSEADPLNRVLIKKRCGKAVTVGVVVAHSDERINEPSPVLHQKG